MAAPQFILALGIIGCRRFRLLLASLEAGVAGIGEFLLELLDATGRVDIFQLAGIERVASIADIHPQFRLCASCFEAVTATAGDLGLKIFRMNAIFHGWFPCEKGENAIVKRRRKIIESCSLYPHQHSRKRGFGQISHDSGKVPPASGI